MPILNNVELHHAYLDPKRPNNRFDKVKPTWEVQVRTTDKAVKKIWEELGIPVKAIVPDEGETFFRANLRKKSVKADGTAGEAPELVDGKGNPVDPKTVGNGSIGNVRIFQYQGTKPDGSATTVSVLMGVQLVKHIVYKPKARDDGFSEIETEVIEYDEDEGSSSGANISV